MPYARAPTEMSKSLQEIADEIADATWLRPFLEAMDEHARVATAEFDWMLSERV